jgi:hypothetical protein
VPLFGPIQCYSPSSVELFVQQSHLPAQPPGARICHLCHPYTVALPLQTGVFGATGIDITVLTGPYSSVHDEYPEQSDYTIDAAVFASFLDEWLRS